MPLPRVSPWPRDHTPTAIASTIPTPATPRSHHRGRSSVQWETRHGHRPPPSPLAWARVLCHPLETWRGRFLPPPPHPADIQSINKPCRFSLNTSLMCPLCYHCPESGHHPFPTGIHYQPPNGPLPPAQSLCCSQRALGVPSLSWITLSCAPLSKPLTCQPSPRLPPASPE